MKIETSAQLNQAATRTQIRADPNQARLVLDSLGVDWCASEARYAARHGAVQATSSACPIMGNPDVPSVRDGSIPSPTTPNKIIRLKFNVFANDDGSSPAATLDQVTAQMSQLNADLAPSRIQFIHQTQFINSSRFRVYTDDEEVAMKSAYSDKPARQHNVFVVDAQTGWIGVSTFPWDSDSLRALGGTMIDAAFFGKGQKTLTHEIGHALGLWHTHHGVEVARCSACYERADDLNRDTTGDFCSDTPPTPVNLYCAPPGGTDSCSNRNWGSTSPQNYMGYAPDSCYREFTRQQMGRLHAWIDESLTGWLESTSEIAVSLDGVVITDGQATPIDFGRVVQGQSGPTQTFAVRNVGGQPLTLGSVTVQGRYTVVKNLPDALAPGQQDTFVVSLQTTAVGKQMGHLLFTNNDSDESPFDFPLTGVVSSRPALAYVTGSSNCPNPDGTEACPFNSLCDGYDAVTVCGTIKFRSGSYVSCRSLLTKCAVLESDGGPVEIRGPGPGASIGKSGLAAKFGVPSRRANGSFGLSFSGVPGQRYQVFTSTDLVTWELWHEFTAGPEPLDLNVPDHSSEPRRFFKLVAPPEGNSRNVSFE